MAVPLALFAHADGASFLILSSLFRRPQPRGNGQHSWGPRLEQTRASQVWVGPSTHVPSALVVHACVSGA
eukprot:775007-Pyramimonas_sp.AAC.1